MKTLGLFLTIFIAGLPVTLVAQDSNKSVRMGVREDVPPFVSKDEETNNYQGFFWDICTAALARAEYAFETVQITARQRTALLTTGGYCPHKLEEKVTCKQPLETVDLMCDPTTITLARMETFASGPASKSEPDGDTGNVQFKLDSGRFVFSPILYLANGSYIQQDYKRGKFRDKIAKKLSDRCNSSHPKINSVLCPKISDPTGLEWLLPPAASKDDETNERVDWDATCKEIITALAEDNKNKKDDNNKESDDDNKRGRWPPQIWPEPEPEQPQFEIWGYVQGATIKPSIERAANRVNESESVSIGVCQQSFDSHTDAVKAFCNGEIYRYFGDIDLVRARVEAYRITHEVSCAADETPSAKGTYEPYAMVLSHERDDDFPEKFTLALYSMFTDGTIQQFFNGRFGEGRQSQYLETLFRINSIPRGSPPADD